MLLKGSFPWRGWILDPKMFVTHCKDDGFIEWSLVWFILIYGWSMSFCGYSDGLVSDSSMLALDGWMITGPSGPHEVLEWFPLVCKIVFWGNALRDMILDPIAWNSPQCQVIHHIHDKLLSALFLLRWRNKATWRFFDFRCLEIGVLLWW